MTRISKLFYGENCNTYVLGDEGQDCLVIDPGSNKHGALDNYIAKHHRRCVGILLTHGHFDHIAGLVDLKCLDSTPVFMDESDIPCLDDPKLNGSDSFELADPIIIKNVQPYPLDDGDEIKIGNFSLVTIETPFHTLGSVCFYDEADKALFSGDTLFHLSIGRTDLPGSAPRSVSASLAKLRKLPTDTKVYPGHGESTTIGNEIKFNPDFR